ncbi:MAG: diaminopropionate ammonia-lyase [Bacteroidales bacterium]|nr:diaminopropionate ammonia-lyase [Bacteroidales bacterium]
MKNGFINNNYSRIPDNSTTRILDASDSISFHSSLHDYAPTPLYKLPELARQYKVSNIYLKDESHRFGLNSFKALGASYAVNKLISNNQAFDTLCTATEGNHGRALAWSARIFNKKCIVFVPGDTALSRIKAIENEGARVVRVDGDYDDACKQAESTSLVEGWSLVQDSAWQGYEVIPAYIMAGYLTAYAELEEDLHRVNQDIDIVMLQAGVGSWAAAGIWYFHARYGKKTPKIIVVEPEEADCILSSFRSGRRTRSAGSNKTIMAGLNCSTASSIAWDIIHSSAMASISISDSSVIKTIKKLYYPSGSDQRIISGESGAAGLAGFMEIMESEEFKPLQEHLDISDKTNVLVFNTEGSTDPVSFNDIIKP